MTLSRRMFAQLLPVIGAGGPLAAKATATLTAAEPTPENTVIHVDSERMRPAPEPSKRMMVVYKPWAVDQSHAEMLCRTLSNQGIYAIMIPTTDESAPDIRFFDLDKTGMDGALETLQAINAQVFERQAIKPTALHEIAMMMGKLISDRMRYKVRYEDSFRENGVPFNSGRPTYVNVRIGANTLKTIPINSVAHAAIEPEYEQVQKHGIAWLTKVWLEPAADHMAEALNSHEQDLLTADMVLPCSGAYGSAGIDFNGIALRAVEYYDVSIDRLITRFDVAFAPLEKDGVGFSQGLAIMTVSPRYDAWIDPRAISIKSTTSIA